MPPSLPLTEQFPELGGAGGRGVSAGANGGAGGVGGGPPGAARSGAGMAYGAAYPAAGMGGHAGGMVPVPYGYAAHGMVPPGMMAGPMAGAWRQRWGWASHSLPAAAYAQCGLPPLPAACAPGQSPCHRPQPHPCPPPKPRGSHAWRHADGGRVRDGSARRHAGKRPATRPRTFGPAACRAVAAFGSQAAPPPPAGPCGYGARAGGALRLHSNGSCRHAGKEGRKEGRKEVSPRPRCKRTSPAPPAQCALTHAPRRCPPSRRCMAACVPLPATPKASPCWRRRSSKWRRIKWRLRMA